MSNEHDNDSEDLSDLIGGADFTGNMRANDLSLKEGSPVICRIMPSIKSCKATNTWAKYWALTWGWKGRNPRDPDKLRKRPVLNIERKNYQTKMIIQDDPLSTLINAKKEELEMRELELRQAKKDLKKDQKYMDLWSWLNDKNDGHSIDAKWRMNVILLSGEFKVLKLNNTCKAKELQPKIDKLISQKLQPLGPNGVFFEFTRMGTGRTTKDSVDPYRVDDAIQFHTLTRSLLESAVKVFPDLNEEAERNRYSYSQLQQLADCSGDPDEVDEILGVPDKEEGGANRVSSSGSGSNNEPPAESDEMPEAEPEPPKAAPKKAPVAATKPVPKLPEPVEEPAEEPETETEEEDEDAKALRELQEKMAAKKAAAAKPAPAKPTKPAPKAAPKKPEPVEELADEPAEEGGGDEWDQIFKKNKA